MVPWDVACGALMYLGSILVRVFHIGGGDQGDPPPETCCPPWKVGRCLGMCLGVCLGGALEGAL